MWSVGADGRNLLASIQDVVTQLSGALAWFSRLDSRPEVLRILLEQEEEDMKTLWGFGRRPSPVRAYLCGCVALSLGRQALAREKLREAV